MSEPSALPAGEITPERKRELYRLWRTGTPDERKAAARELQLLSSRSPARKRRRETDDSRAVATAVAGVQRATPSAAAALAPPPRVIALTAADITESQRRELFELAVAELKSQLQATMHLPLMDRGKVIGHREVPDNASRIKAIGQTFAFLGSTSPGARGGASHPQKIEIKVAQFGPRPSTQAVSADVIEASEA